MTPRRAFWIVLILLAACSASARQKTIATTLAATDAARFAFVAYDAKHQQDIVAAAVSHDAAVSLLTDYRRKRGGIETAFALTYRAIAAAATVNDQPTLDGMMEAAAILAGALHDLGVQ